MNLWDDEALTKALCAGIEDMNLLGFRVISFGSVLKEIDQSALILAIQGYFFNHETHSIDCHKCGSYPHQSGCELLLQNNQIGSPPPNPAPKRQQPTTPEWRLPETVQEAINNVPKTHKLSTLKANNESHDPRKSQTIPFLDAMRNKHQRRLTYYDWPDGAWQDPDNLVSAGFFFTGSADRVMCFACRTVLRNWEPNDIPLQVHETFTPDCPFVLECKESSAPPEVKPFTPPLLHLPSQWFQRLETNMNSSVMNQSELKALIMHHGLHTTQSNLLKIWQLLDFSSMEQKLKRTELPAFAVGEDS